MIEQIIKCYLYDEALWEKHGNEQNYKNFKAVQPLLSDDFVNCFINTKGFHDWLLSSFSIVYQEEGARIQIELVDDYHNVKNKLVFLHCSGFCIKGNEPENCNSLGQIQIMCFEKKDSICIGIGTTTGAILLIYCKEPIISIE